MCKCCKRCRQEEVLNISHLVTAASLVLTLQEGNKSFLESHISKAPQHLCSTETNLETKQVDISTKAHFSKLGSGLFIFRIPQPCYLSSFEGSKVVGYPCERVCCLSPVDFGVNEQRGSLGVNE